MARFWNADNKALYGRLFSYLAGYWRIFAFSILAMLIVAASAPAFAALIKPLINEGFVEKNLQAMRWVPVAIVALFLVRGLANFANEYLTSYLSGHLVQRLREEMFAKMQRLPVGFYHEESSGRTMSRVLNDANLISDAGFNVITVLAKDGIGVVGLLFLLFYLDWQLTIITFLAFPVVGLGIRWVGLRLRQLSRENQQHMGQMTQVLSENIDCTKVVKVYGGQHHEQQRFALSAVDVRRNTVKQTAANSANTGITQLMVSIALATIIYFAAMRSQNNTFSAGDFMSFLTAMVMMFDPVKRITGIMQSLQRGMAAAESIFHFLDIPEEKDSGSLTIQQKAQGAIRLENIAFAYPHAEKNSINRINLNIRSGEMIALVGESGCGKSTLVNLLPRFFEPQQGKIYLDDIPIEEYTLSDLRRQMALVSQDVTLFNDTIAANVAYGDCADAAESSIIEALKAANAWEFIQKMPEGIHTLVGENGAKLSGGQRQRLAIARALLKNAPILILDEATSALDNESEKLVQTALDKLMQSRTTIVIAHRLSTVEHADRIIVMQEGKIAEEGTHKALLQQKGRYNALYQMQFSDHAQQGD